MPKTESTSNPKPKRGRKPKSPSPESTEPSNPLDSLVDDSGSLQPPAAPADPSAKLTRFDRVNVVQIHRSQLKNASYNPRTISPSAIIDLRKSLQQHGLVEPLIWNVRTGNLVGGHQRLSQLDILESSPNYLIHVNQIDIDERQERALNIMLNNPQAMGEYDVPVLIDMYRQDTFDLDLTAFKPIDLELMAYNAGLDTELIDSLFTPAAIEEIKSSTAEIDAILDQSDEIKKRRADEQNRANGNGSNGNGQSATRRQSQDEDEIDDEGSDADNGIQGDSAGSHGRHPEAAAPIQSDQSHTHSANGQPLTPEHFRAMKRAGEEKLKPQRESAYYLTLSFPSNAIKFAFCNAIGIPESAAHADGITLAELAGIKLPSINPEKISIEDANNT